MKPVLIVENSKSAAESISSLVQRELGLATETAHSLEDAALLLEQSETGFTAGIFGLFLEDASGIEIIDFAIAQSIPPIVFTGTMQPDMRKQMWARDIVDYVVKESPESLRQIVAILKRLTGNRKLQVLVADPRPQFLDFVARLLGRHQFQVLRAETGQEAARLMEDTPDLQLLLLGDALQDVNPITFIEKFRKKRDMEQTAIITLCTRDNTEVAINALKRGANDFLAWPFAVEEFYSRINNAMDTLGLLSHLRTLNRTDFLTGVFNRGHLMQILEAEHKRSQRHNHVFSVIMIDADKFKNINDTYGHGVGDLVLIELAKTVQQTIRVEDSLGRYGGEEFVVALPETDREEAVQAAERIRTAVEATAIETDDETVRFTISLGVTTMYSSEKCTPLGALLNEADQALYEAKETGRNRTIHHSDMPESEAN